MKNCTTHVPNCYGTKGDCTGPKKPAMTDATNVTLTTRQQDIIVAALAAEMALIKSYLDTGRDSTGRHVTDRRRAALEAQWRELHLAQETVR